MGIPEKIVKRDGKVTTFNPEKITQAIYSAARAVGGRDYFLARSVTDDVLHRLNGVAEVTVEEIQNIVEEVLIKNGHDKTAKAYILYRDRRTGIREARSELMNAVSDILRETHRENANVSNSPSAKKLQISEAAAGQFYLSRVINPDHAEAHTDGYIHIHDIAWYGKTMTCLQVPLGHLLDNGFNTGNGFIRSPKSIRTATALACIILQSNQNDQHGGQSFAFFDRDLAPYVEKEYQKQKKLLRTSMENIAPELLEDENAVTRLENLALDKTREETFQAMEAFIFNCNSMHSRAGAQVPFSSIALGTDTSFGGRMATEQLLLAYEKGLGKGEQPIFPNIGFKIKSGINYNPDDENHDLFNLAMKVASKRLFPAFINLDADFNARYDDEVCYMGCRTRVIANVNGPEVTDGRGNLSFTSINLPRLGIEAEGDWDLFFEKLDKNIQIIINQLIHRYHIQKNLRVRDFPFLFGEKLYLDSRDLADDDKIEAALKHGTLSMGFIGLAEALIAMTGKHHGESSHVQEKGLEIVAFMRKAMDEATRKHNMNFTLLGTPAEGLSGKFVRKDREKYGTLEGITDKEWYTNSFHVPVEHDIYLFDKVDTEAQYHEFCNAGHISYVELDSSLEQNLIAYEEIVRGMHERDMGYFSINFPVDFCSSCSYSGIINGNNCPACNGDSIKRVRRITGYLSELSNFNDAKLNEERSRVSHV